MAAPPAPLPSSTANWHWKNKNITKWGQDWFEQELTGLRVETDEEGEAVWISNVFNVAGDIELGQRKSKYVCLFAEVAQCSVLFADRLITIYDCELALEWEGTTADGTEVKGRLDIPEVSHEITMDGLSQYQVCAAFLLSCPFTYPAPIISSFGPSRPRQPQKSTNCLRSPKRTFLKSSKTCLPSSRLPFSRRMGRT